MVERSTKETLARFGTVVKTMRQQLGITQEELADRSGLHRTYITDVEGGARNVSIDSITKLASALHVSLADIFARIDERSLDETIANASGKRHISRPVEILLVEDNSKDIELTLLALQKNRVANLVQVVKTGEEALHTLLAPYSSSEPRSSHKPDVVLLDLTLPGVGGLEVLTKIRSESNTRTMPVVILTASRSDQDYKESMKLGATAYITKPVDFLEFSTVMPTMGFDWLLVEKT